MAKADDFPRVFRNLRALLAPLARDLVVKADAAGNYSLNTPWSAKYNKELFFGAAQIKKRYVSYHLFPVYMFPDLLQGISPSLRARMHGKSCFNFTTLEPDQARELRELTHRAFVRLREEQLVSR